MGIMGIVNEEKTKDEQCSSSSKSKPKMCRRIFGCSELGFVIF